MVMEFVRQLEGVERVFNREEALLELELPPDRVGELGVLADASTVIGTSPRDHDLSALGKLPLRSHGGLAEQRVPFILSRPLRVSYALKAGAGRLRNFDIFDFAINGTLW